MVGDFGESVGFDICVYSKAWAFTTLGDSILLSEEEGGPALPCAPLLLVPELVD